MGDRAKILLVAGFIAMISLAYARGMTARYQEYWLWSGVRSQPLLANAQTLYILRGVIERPRHRSQAVYTPQGSGKIIMTRQDIWLVYRVYTLDWSDNIFTAIQTELARWQQQGIMLKGIQIDFDVATRKLADYADFLNQLRHWLPQDYRLSITGLLDWGRYADPEAISALNLSIDEVIFQTYQGRHTIPDYQAYLQKLKALTIPFKVGVVQNGRWEEPAYLWKNPNFKGFVLFLVNPEL